MQTIQQIQNEIIDEFDFFEDWSEKYQYLIDLGKNLPNFDNKSRIDSNLIKGCQSKVWLNTSFKNVLNFPYRDGNILMQTSFKNSLPKFRHQNFWHF